MEAADKRLHVKIVLDFSRTSFQAKAIHQIPAMMILEYLLLQFAVTQMVHEIPAEDARFASLVQFRESFEKLFEVPEIRRVCFENLVAFNVINGGYCRIHSLVGFPLPVRRRSDGEKGITLLDFDQHTLFAKGPKHIRPRKRRFRHNSLIATSAYEPAT